MMTDIVSHLAESKDGPAVDALIAHVRKHSPRPITATEMGLVLDRPKRQIYGLVKLARRLLAATTGESIPNVRRVGYRISNTARALLFESVKSGARANGHLAAEAESFRRVDKSTLTCSADVEIYACQQASVVLGEARLSLAAKLTPALHRLAANRALSDVATSDAATPWKSLGLDDPDEPRN